MRILQLGAVLGLAFTSTCALAQLTNIEVVLDTVFYAPTSFNDSGEPLYEGLDGYATFEIFATFTNPTDAISAVYADYTDDHLPMYVNAPCGCFNPTVGDALVSTNPNPPEIAEFPEVEFDTYWTLDFAENTTGVFPNTNYTSSTMCAEVLDDGVFFQAPAVPVGPDLKVKIGQITTCGSFEFHFCVQVFIEGNLENPQQICIDELQGGPVEVSFPCTSETAPAVDLQCLGNGDVEISLVAEQELVDVQFWQSTLGSSFSLMPLDSLAAGVVADETSQYFIATLDENMCFDTTAVFNLNEFVGCIDSCGTPIIQADSVVLSGISEPYILACPGEELEFDGSLSMGTGDAPLTYHWTLGYEELATDDPVATLEAPDEGGLYWATLQVEDVNACALPALDSLMVIVSPVPEVTMASNSPVCAGSMGFAEVVGVSAGAISYQEFATEAEFPILDALNMTTSAPIFVSGFAEGSTIDDCSDVERIGATLEHSFVGDLTIWVECPNGQEMLLLDNGPSGGADPTGCMYPDLGGNDLGDPFEEVGWAYDWSLDAEFIIDDPSNPAVQGGAAIPPGDYLPCGSPCDLIGCPINGEWTLNIQDQWLGDNGTLFAWEIEFGSSNEYEVLQDLPMYVGWGVMDSGYWSSWSNEVVVNSYFANGNYLEFTADSAGQFAFNYSTMNSLGCEFDTAFVVDVVAAPEFQFELDMQYDACFGTTIESEFSFVPEGDNSGCLGAAENPSLCYGNEGALVTICPDDLASGQMMHLHILSGEVESFFDQFIVYDGVDNTAPILLEATGDLEGLSFQATNASGCLTLQVVADPSVSCESGNFEPITWCTSCSDATIEWGECTQFYWDWEPSQLFGETSNEREPTILDAVVEWVQPTLNATIIGQNSALCNFIDHTFIFPTTYPGSVILPECINLGPALVTFSPSFTQGTFEVYVNNVFDQVVVGGGSFEIGPLDSGDYVVTAFSSQGACLFNHAFSLDLSDENLDADQICLVTVDEESQKPFIHWPNASDNAITSWELQRLDAETGGFQTLAVIDNNGATGYFDGSANPGAHAEHYNLIALDACGAFIDEHPLVESNFLSGSYGLNGAINLYWNPSTTPEDHYAIQRAVDQGAFETIAEVMGIHEFTDLNVPSGAEVSYRIRQFLPEACGPNEWAHSNIIGTATTGIHADDLQDFDLLQLGVGSGRFEIRSPSRHRGVLNVYDAQGRIVQIISVTQQNRQIDITGIGTGVYLLEFRTTDGLRHAERFVLR